MNSPEDVHHSVSSWQQPCPPGASAERGSLVEEIARRIVTVGQGRVLVRIEGYYRNAYDYAALQRLLLDPVRSPETASCALCGIDPLTQQDHSSDVTAVSPDAVLIVDGVFAFRPEINEYRDFRIWLRVDDELSVRRGAERDQDWAGSDAESIHRDRYLAAERIYLAEVDPLPMTDIVIGNSVFERPRIMSS